MTPVPAELVDDIVSIAQIPAPTFAEDARIEWIERRLAGSPAGFRRDAVGNLLWLWGDAPPRLLVTAHVDTVFPAEIPHAARRDGDHLVGPGVGDNAAAVATVIRVVERLLRTRELAPGGVAFTVAEEGLGNLRGARAACEALRPATLIALEGHGLDSVVVDAVGSVRARVVVRGPGGHSWVDRGRPSAIHALLALGSEFIGLGTEPAPVNIGLVSGGRTVNTIAEEAHLVLEMRCLDEEPLEEFARTLARARLAPPLQLSVEAIGRRPAGKLARDSDLLAAITEVRAALGLSDVLESGSTDANAALSLGIPAACLGVARGSGMHTLAERIDTTSLALGARQLEDLLVRLLG